MAHFRVADSVTLAAVNDHSAAYARAHGEINHPRVCYRRPQGCFSQCRGVDVGVYGYWHAELGQCTEVVDSLPFDFGRWTDDPVIRCPGLHPNRAESGYADRLKGCLQLGLTEDLFDSGERLLWAG